MYIYVNACRRAFYDYNRMYSKYFILFIHILIAPYGYIPYKISFYYVC